MMDIKQAINSYNTTFGVEFRPKAVLFDMDGVLYDSMPHHAIAWQKSMAQFGINMTARRLCHRGCTRLRHREDARQATERYRHL